MTLYEPETTHGNSPIVMRLHSILEKLTMAVEHGTSTIPYYTAKARELLDEIRRAES